ncbi:UNVERIFIED_CONTAM: hypothetical protein Sradi_1464500 [Sesamum radiatum]|uniref:Interferon-related developmental regulator N-terminal domain-containing protein n=1 Tax=Sesamum radiatum TaxID=300843 RepID=A0AAW2U747_SESRA
MDKFLDDLFAKRGSVREGALSSIVDGLNFNYRHQFAGKKAIPYFLDLLEVDDQSVCMAAGEAIALICEMGFLEKFAGNPTTDEISLNEKGKNIKDQDYSIQELQEIVSNHAKRVLRQNSLQSTATKTVNGWSNFSQNVLQALERAHRPQRSAFRKAKTQLLNKQRMLKGEELGAYDD